MKKKKLSELTSDSIGNTDRILIQRGSQSMLARRMNVSTTRFIQNIRIGPETEYEIPGTETSSSGNSTLINILIHETGSSVLILLGFYASLSHRVVIASVGTTSVGVSSQGTENILVYRKLVNSNIFVKNNSSTSFLFDFKVI